MLSSSSESGKDLQPTTSDPSPPREEATIGRFRDHDSGGDPMKAALRVLPATLVAVVAFLAPSTAAAAPTSTSFTIVGYEYAFTSTVGSFAGSGSGNAGETAVWNARVEHDRLGSNPTYVDGGSFAMATTTPSGALDFVSGAFAYHGGTITTVNTGANCTNQQYRVSDRLENVRTSTTSGGSGSFAVTLTHYRYSLFGHCVIYKARVSGALSVSYQAP